MTAGPDERTLHVIPGGGPETEQEAEERIREELHRRGVGPGGPASSPPPMPDHPPTVPAQPAADDERAGRTLTEWWHVLRARAADQDQAEQAPQDAAETAPARADNDRLPPWWDRRKPHLADLDAEPEPDEEPDQGDDGEDVEPEPKAKGRGPRPARRRVSKTSQPADDEDEQDDDAEEAGEEQVPDGPRWSRPTLGRPPGLPAKRHNLLTWWRGIAPHTKGLLYHGTGLGAGVYFGVFAWGTRGAEFVTQEGLGDLEADFTLGLLGLVLVVDYRVRNLFPPLAWVVRAVSTSLVIGAAWNGTPLADLTN